MGYRVSHCSTYSSGGLIVDRQKSPGSVVRVLAFRTLWPTIHPVDLPRSGPFRIRGNPIVASYLTGVLSTTDTPQGEPIPGSPQVANSASGYSFHVDKWQSLRRFLILGSEGGSYYASEQKLTQENAKNVLACIQEDGLRAVEEIVAVSDAGRAPKNDPALFALAMASRLGETDTKKAAFHALPKVARIGTHLFHFLAYMEQFGHWAALPRRGVAAWYEDMPLDRLVDQAIKYQSRDGWGHADAIRLSHPRAHGALAREAVFRYMSYGTEPDRPQRGSKVKGYMPEAQFREVLAEASAMNAIRGVELVKAENSAPRVAQIVRDYKLPREVVPTEHLDSTLVWEALLPDMGITALIRNLAKMTSIGMIAPGSDATREVIRRLSDMEGLRRGRVHPITILLAMMTYKLGHGVKGSLKWEPVTAVLDALDKAFYLAFGNVEPSNAAWEMWLDISGSMGMGAVAGIPNFTPRDASAAFALINASVESQCEFYGFSHVPVKLSISPRQRLDDAINTISRLPFGATDCSLPMEHALKAGRKADVFCVLTDSETFAGQRHPVQALREYRAKVNPKAKLIVVAMVANPFTIADPADAGMMDVVGFDAAAPALMSLFAAGKL